MYNRQYLFFDVIESERVGQVLVGQNNQGPDNLGIGFQSLKRLFSCNGQVALDILPEKPTLIARYYVNTVLSSTMEFIREKRRFVRTKNTSLLRDNAIPHKAKVAASCSDE